MEDGVFELFGVREPNGTDPNVIDPNIFYLMKKLVDRMAAHTPMIDIRTDSAAAVPIDLLALASRKRIRFSKSLLVLDDESFKSVISFDIASSLLMTWPWK